MAKLSERMKQYYESTFSYRLIKNVPVIIRLDGRSFHKLTKTHFTRPFDLDFSNCMLDTARDLMHEIQGCKIGYVMSDEISLLLTDFNTFEDGSWFDYRVQKLASVSAAICTCSFMRHLYSRQETADMTSSMFKISFDSRVFNVPTHDVRNYFVWRQQECVRNAINGIAQIRYSSSELKGVSTMKLKGWLEYDLKGSWVSIFGETYSYGSIIDQSGCIHNTIIPDESLDSLFEEVTTPFAKEIS